MSENDDARWEAELLRLYLAFGLMALVAFVATVVLS